MYSDDVCISSRYINLYTDIDKAICEDTGLMVYEMFYTITLFNLVVPTCTVWQVILFRETGVFHRIKYRLVISFYLLFYLLNLLLI